MCFPSGLRRYDVGMGGIWMPRRDFLEELNDGVGARVGLAIPDRTFIDALREVGAESLIEGPREALVRLRSGEYEEMGVSLLARFGYADARDGDMPVTRYVFRAWQVDPSSLEVLWRVLEMAQGADHERPTLDPTLSIAILAGSLSPLSKRLDAIASLESLSADVWREFGQHGIDVFRGLQHAMKKEMSISLLMAVERFKAEEIIPLSDLYNSPTLHEESFLDQRFIDFLSANLPELGRMHWRKFEGLCATYFLRRGFEVHLGPGSNDDGVDIRVWPVDTTEDVPPLTIIQCKRITGDVPKVIVKSLAEDVRHYGAHEGVIATTGRLAPGALHTIGARRYPISVADRDKIEEWVEELKTPGTGIDLLSEGP